MNSLGAAAFVALVVAAPVWAQAQAPADPDLTLAARETLDFWSNVSGGVQQGSTTLNKLQVSGTWTANQIGDPLLRVHAQIFRTNGERLTSRVGDIQTVSNIEAISTTRLFEAWVEQGFGKAGDGGVVVRAGLVDLNSDFDSIAPASLFLNSSQGIGPDLSKSGRNGPSIFPVSAAAVRLTYTPSEDWTLRAAVFDGVPGNPDRPKAFVEVRLARTDGALTIGEVDRKLGKDGQLSIGAWGYSEPAASLDGTSRQHDAGMFAFLYGPAPGFDGWNGWVRAGLANGRAQLVSSYLGLGVVGTGALPSRPKDKLGFSVSRAGVSSQARRLEGLRRAETTFETTYQVRVADWLAVQPDAQYVVHPSSRAKVSNAMVVGLRFVVTSGYPKKADAAEQADPTVPPDNPSDQPSM